MNRSNPTRGFTLIELMLVVAIIGILSALAVGAAGRWRSNPKVRDAARRTYGVLNMARAEAIRSARTIKVDIGNDFIRAFSDTNGNNDWDATEDVVAIYPDTGGDRDFYSSQTYDLTDFPFTIDASDFDVGGGNLAVIFDQEGMSLDELGEPRSGQINISSSAADYTFVVDLTIAGALRVRQ